MMAVSFRLTMDRIAVRRDGAAEKTAGGLIMPERAQQSPNAGTVVATGPGRTGDNGELLPMSVKVGDHVMFMNAPGGVLDVVICGEPLVLMSETFVLVISDPK